MERLSKIALWVVFGVSIVAPAYLLWGTAAMPEHWHGVLILMVTLPSLLVGLARLWVERQGYAEQARAYRRMADLFEKHQAGREDTLEELGVEALEENGDWLTLHRDGPLRVQTS